MKQLFPIRFDGYMLNGGSTKPWRVVAIEKDSLVEVPYVVKVFSPKHIEQGHNIGKEFVGNMLAGQFDLNVPEAGIINLHDESFVSTLPDDLASILATKYEGLTFASKLTDGSIMNEHLRSSSYSIHDSASLFAFDCLIHNIDRGGYHNKPNLLVDDNGLILIDHELTFNFIDSTDHKAFDKVVNHLDGNVWPDFYQKHFFYNHLKAYKGSKKALFDTFEESLRTLDIVKMQNFINDLTKMSVELGESDLVIKYLCTLKQNAHKFRSILLGLIS